MSVLSPPPVSDKFARTSCERQPSSGAGLTTTALRKAVLAKLRGISGGSLTIIDGDTQTRLGDSSADLHVVITIHDRKFYRALALGGSIAAGETYRDGLWSCDDLVGLIQIFCRNLPASAELGGVWNSLLGLGRIVRHKLRRNTKAGSRQNISAHYDLSNDFYALFLDPTMTYSSGVFTTPTSTLQEASIEKYDRICRKLRLQPQDRLLEIGTGWGGFAEHAVTHYGCHVTTTTISRQQHDYAQRRFSERGISDRVTLLMSDYRDLTGQYDKLVSIEMIEAVGHEYFDTFFARCSALLKSDGMFALQAITIPDQRYEQYRRTVDFIQKYIFPGGCLPSIGAMVGAVGRVTDLRLTHTEDFAEHYARTLQAWRIRCLANTLAISALGMTEQFQRLWEYYLCYCEGAFREQQIGVAQFVFQKPGNRLAAHIPSLA